MLVRLHFLAALLALAGAFAPPALASDFDIDTSFGLTQGTPGWRRSRRMLSSAMYWCTDWAHAMYW